MSIVMKSYSCLYESLKERLAVAGLLKPYIFQGIMAFVEVALIEEFEPLLELKRKVVHSGVAAINASVDISKG